VRSPVGLPLNFPFAMDAEAGGKSLRRLLFARRRVANRYGVCSLGVLAAGGLVCFIGRVGKKDSTPTPTPTANRVAVVRGRHEIRGSYSSLTCDRYEVRGRYGRLDVSCSDQALTLSLSLSELSDQLKASTSGMQANSKLGI
jgi:hypothetical protein